MHIRNLDKYTLSDFFSLIQIEVLLLFDVKLGVLASAEHKRSDASLVYISAVVFSPICVS